MKLPFYAKISLISLGVFSLASMLYVSGNILVPILIAAIIAIVLSPVIEFMVRKKINRVLSISLTLGFLILITLFLLLLLTSRLTDFIEKFPIMMNKFYSMVNHAVDWLSEHFHIRTPIINSFIDDTKSELLNTGKEKMGAALASMGEALISITLIPVYVFMLLYYQSLLLEFFRRVFGENNEEKVQDILGSTKSIVQSYLIGLLLQILIIAVLNSVGLLILGIEYAILLGVFGALFNLIPYLGGVISMTLFAIVALVTKESSIYMLYVVILYSIIQFIDNNYIVPKLIGSKVKINALIAIIAVIVGGALWGIAGMFLSLPIIAITKLIFDRIEVLKPWGFLLGDTMPPFKMFKKKNE